MLQVHAVTPCMASGLEREMPDLIEHVGGVRFAQRLFAALRPMTGCDHLVAFESGIDDPPLPVFTENVGPERIAREIAASYSCRYWRMDPVRTLFSNKDAAPGCRMLETTPIDIDHSGYRLECYTRVGLRHRLSVCDLRPTGTVRLNFYKGERFSMEQQASILEAAYLLMPLIRRHTTDRPKRPDGSAAAFRERLAVQAPGLSRRETEVCALIAAGVSSAGIALELGVSLNTVLTYRKRAYQRLNISSQNELMRAYIV